MTETTTTFKHSSIGFRVSTLDDPLLYCPPCASKWDYVFENGERFNLERQGIWFTCDGCGERIRNLESDTNLRASFVHMLPPIYDQVFMTHTSGRTVKLRGPDRNLDARPGDQGWLVAWSAGGTWRFVPDAI